MGYRKLKADHLFTGFQLLDSRQVLIVKQGGEIAAIVNEQDAGEDIETLNGIITPGFINAHCHLELSHMRGLIPERSGLADFVFKVITERHFPDDEILDAINKAEEQMIKNGIVAAGDICNNLLTLPRKLHHHLSYYNFIEVSGWTPSVAQLRWGKGKDLYDEFVKEGMAASMVPHAPYSVSGELWKKLMLFFEGKTITMHNQETVSENELFLKNTGDFINMYRKMGIDNSLFSPGGKTSLQTCFSNLANADSVILVHNTFTSQVDIDYINANKPASQLVSFCLCPNANLYIENKLPPVEMLEKNNCFITIGTDSLASNTTLDILGEMKTIQYGFPSIPLDKILGWATLNGARALQMEETTGSFEQGKKPGVVLIENVDGKILKKESTVKRII